MDAAGGRTPALTGNEDTNGNACITNALRDRDQRQLHLSPRPLHFPKDQLPEQYATYFWSVIAVDSAHRRVLPNPLKRYLLNKETNPQYGQDGSLTLYFADAKPKEAPERQLAPDAEGDWIQLDLPLLSPEGRGGAAHVFPAPLTRL